MEEKKIKAVKTWPETQSVKDFQVFLGFANFYRRFIKNFSKIASPLTSMLRTTTSASSPTNGSKEAVKRTGNGVGSGGVCGVGGDGGAGSVGRKTKNLSKAKNFKKSAKSKNQILQKPKTAIEPPEKIFLLPKLGLHSPNYEKPLPKHQSFIILIRNAISGLKLMH